MKCSVKGQLVEVYESSYKDSDGNNRVTYNVEMFNPDWEKRYERYLTLNVDEDVYKKLSNQEKYKRDDVITLHCIVGQYNNRITLRAYEVV